MALPLFTQVAVAVAVAQALAATHRQIGKVGAAVAVTEAMVAQTAQMEALTQAVVLAAVAGMAQTLTEEVVGQEL
jgi:hypothetical protein